jgi:hypothetical protein
MAPDAAYTKQVHVDITITITPAAAGMTRDALAPLVDEALNYAIPKCKSSVLDEVQAVEKVGRGETLTVKCVYT